MTVTLLGGEIIIYFLTKGGEIIYYQHKSYFEPPSQYSLKIQLYTSYNLKITL